MNVPRWVIVIVAIAVLIGLIAFARGPDHHRGDEVGESTSAGGLVLVHSGEHGVGTMSMGEHGV
jgi:hypothetical protein